MGVKHQASIGQYVHLNSRLKRLYLNSKMENFSCKDGAVYADVHISRHSKEDLAQAIDECLHITKLFKTVIRTTKELKNKAGFKFKTMLHVFLNLRGEMAVIIV